MRFWVAIVLLLSPAIVPAAMTDCHYFLVKYELEKCAKVPVSQLPTNVEPYPGTEEALGTPDRAFKRSEEARKVRCWCQYTLSGANPLCSTDQDKTITQVVETEDPKTACQEESLCRILCPTTLP